jgi:predicted dehydrogenase
MAKTYRLGVIGFAHMHINSLMRSFKEVPNVEWVACADTVPEVPELIKVRSSRAANMELALNEIGIPKGYKDYREMLAKEKFDLVLFNPENAKHGEVGEAIAANGAHMLTEKPMSASLPDALRMARAAKAAGVELFVNWPITWSAPVRKAKELAEAGVIGDVWEVRTRMGSMGPMSHGEAVKLPDGTERAMTGVEKGAMWWHRAGTGGGALLDYCCYGACLSRWYIGKPAQAAFGLTANINSHWGSAEDNAVITVRFPNALAVLEATWSTVDHGMPAGPFIYGKTGTIVIDRQGTEQVVKIHRGRGQEVEIVPGGVLPAGRDTLGKEIINHLETGEPVHETLQAGFNLDAMAILDAGIRSAASGKMELINNWTWGVG